MLLATFQAPIGLPGDCFATFEEIASRYTGDCFTLGIVTGDCFKTHLVRDQAARVVHEQSKALAREEEHPKIM